MNTTSGTIRCEETKEEKGEITTIIDDLEKMTSNVEFQISAINDRIFSPCPQNPGNKCPSVPQQSITITEKLSVVFERLKNINNQLGSIDLVLLNKLGNETKLT